MDQMRVIALALKPALPRSNLGTTLQVTKANIDFRTMFQYSYAVNCNVQKTKQACLCCTCSVCVSSGAGT
jgi:hypothetical protein